MEPAPSTERTGIFLGEMLAGAYAIERTISEGSASVVLAGRKGDARYAIKLLRTEEPAIVARFREAAKALMCVGHPNVVKVHAVGDATDGLPWMAMDLLEGDDLEARLALQGRFAIDETISCMLQACEGIAAMHDGNLLHCDLQLRSLFLARDAIVRVLDLGLGIPFPRLAARESLRTKPGDIAGTSYFLAPEQIRRAEVDERTDVWALGCCLFRLLTNRHPFPGTNLTEVCAGILDEPPLDVVRQRPEIGPGMVGVIKRALEKAPRDRYPSVRAFAQALRGVRDEVRNTPVIPVPPTLPEPEAMRASRRPTPRAMHVASRSDEVPVPTTQSRSSISLAPATDEVTPISHAHAEVHEADFDLATGITVPRARRAPSEASLEIATEMLRPQPARAPAPSEPPETRAPRRQPSEPAEPRGPLDLAPRMAPRAPTRPVRAPLAPRAPEGPRAPAARDPLPSIEPIEQETMKAIQAPTFARAAPELVFDPPQPPKPPLDETATIATNDRPVSKPWPDDEDAGTLALPTVPLQPPASSPLPATTLEGMPAITGSGPITVAPNTAAMPDAPAPAPVPPSGAYPEVPRPMTPAPFSPPEPRSSTPSFSLPVASASVRAAGLPKRPGWLLALAALGVIALASAAAFAIARARATSAPVAARTAEPAAKSAEVAASATSTPVAAATTSAPSATTSAAPTATSTAPTSTVSTTPATTAAAKPTATPKPWTPPPAPAPKRSDSVLNKRK